MGFKAIASFRSNYFRKIFIKPGMFQLAVLGFFKAIGDQVKFVLFGKEVIKDLYSIREQYLPCRQAFKKMITHFTRQCFVRYLKVK